jgi:hypothetical protein
VATDPFRIAQSALAEAEGRISDLARPFLDLLPVSGASISTFGPLLGAETISATDALASRIDELQFDLGEGPCWDALSTRHPVIEPDLAVTDSWPAFAEAVRREEVAAIFAFPLVFGPLEIGAVDLYSTAPRLLTVDQQRQALALSAIVSRIMLRHAIGESVPTATSTYSRRLVHQATGMVLAQLETTPDDAYLIIQARAYAENRSMREVAEDVIARRVSFSALPGHGPQSTEGAP